MEWRALFAGRPFILPTSMSEHLITWDCLHKSMCQFVMIERLQVVDMVIGFVVGTAFASAVQVSAPSERNHLRVYPEMLKRLCTYRSLRRSS